jgi:hypothetical protein
VEFEAWMAEVDKLFIEKIGLTSGDLADMCWRDWFDDGLTPKQAVATALEDGVLS